jgi:integrase
MSDHSTRKRRSRKASDRPKKPYPDFPLTPHASGAWQKKIRGKIHYFGKWAKRVNGKLVRIEGDGWEDALELYKSQADDLHAGRKPRTKTDGLTVAYLCNAFLTAKLRQREAGELGVRALGEYKQTTDLLIGSLGKTRVVDNLGADDFEALRATMAERWGPVRLGTEIQKVRTVFKYGFESGLLDRPVRYGPQFKKPSAGVLRRHRAKAGAKMLEAGEVRRLIEAAAVPYCAAILLGVNAGFGNTDVAELPLSALDLDGGWIDYPRPKTGVPRRCPLWPETVAALREVLARRPEPKDPAAANRVFVNARGAPLVCIRETNRTAESGVEVSAPEDPAPEDRIRKANRTDGVSVQFSALLKRLKLHRAGIGFYTLRHVFRTVADAARDPVAIDLIMGHSDPSMGGHYRERVEDSRLKAVAEHVRQWLFGKAPDGGTTEPESTTQETSDHSDPSDPDDLPRPDEGDARPTLRLFAG